MGSSWIALIANCNTAMGQSDKEGGSFGGCQDQEGACLHLGDESRIHGDIFPDLSIDQSLEIHLHLTFYALLNFLESRMKCII